MWQKAQPQLMSFSCLKNTWAWSMLCAYLATSFIAQSALAQGNPFPDHPNPGNLSVTAGSSENVIGSPALTFVASMNSYDVTVDNQGRVYFDHNSNIRRIEANGTISDFTAHDPGYVLSDFEVRDSYLYYLSSYIVWRKDVNTGITEELPNYVDPNLENAGEYYGREKMAVDADHNVYVYRASKIYRIDAVTREVEYFAGNGEIGYSGDGVSAKETPTNVEAMVVDPADNSLLIVGVYGQHISRIDPETGVITEVSGSVPQSMTSIAVLPDGNLLVAGQTRIYRVSHETGAAEAIAGNGYYESTGDGGPASEAGMQPLDLAVDNGGNIYFTSYYFSEYANKLRLIEPRHNYISTVMGAPGFLSCASATSNLLSDARGIQLDASGVIYLQAENAILAVDERLDLLYTVAGVYGSAGSSADGVPAFGNPITPYGDWERSFTIAPNGDIYIAEEGRLRRVDRATGLLNTLATGDFTRLTHDGNQHVYALREQPDWVDIVRIDDNSGDVTVVVGGGLEAPVVGESAQGRRFGAPGWYTATEGIAVDSAGNIFLAIHRVPDGFPQGVFRIDGQSKVFSAVTSFGSGYSNIDVGYGGLALDENNGMLYYGGLWLDSYHAGVVQVELATGEQKRFAARYSGSSTALRPTSYVTDPLDSNFNPRDLAVSANGDLYIVDRASLQLSQAVLKISPETPLGNDLIPPDIGTGANVGDSVARYGNWTAVGVPNSRSGSGEVLVYQDNDCRPILQDRVQAPADTTASKFGEAITFAGESLVIAASQDQAYRMGVFELTDRSWQIKRDLSSELPANGPAVDISLASSGRVFAVGSPGANEGRGQVKVFYSDALDSPTTVDPIDTDVTDFGKSLALNSTHLAVGANSTGAGSLVQVYERDSAGIEQSGTIRDADDSGGFATGLAISEEALYVGSPNPSGGRVFDYSLEQLALSDTLSDPDNPVNPGFGTALAFEDGLLVVGAPETHEQEAASMAASPPGTDGHSKPETSHSTVGSVHVFGTRNKQGDKQNAFRLFSQLAEEEDALGYDLDINDGRIIAGAPERDGGRGGFDYFSRVIDASIFAGMWYDPTLEGEGFNVLVTPNGLAVYFYGYAADGEGLWLLSDVYQGEIRFGQDINLPLYKAVRGEFDSPVPSSEALIKYGSLSMSFGSLRSATFTINGFDGSKISNVVFLADSQANAAAFSGAWYDKSLNGEGYNVVSGKNGTVIFFYGSDSNGNLTWLLSEVVSSEISDGTLLQGNMYEANGGDFFHPAPSATSLTKWGTFEARFYDCNSGQFNLSGKDGDKVSNIVKLAGVKGAACP